MTITSFTCFLAVASLSLFCRTNNSTSIRFQLLLTVGVTFSGITPEMQAKAAEERAAEEVNDAWPDMDFSPTILLLKRRNCQRSNTALLGIC